MMPGIAEANPGPSVEWLRKVNGGWIPKADQRAWGTYGGGTVTDSAGPRPDAGRGARPPYRVIAWAVLRIVGSITALVAVYYALPLDRSSTAIAVTVLVIGLAVFIALVAFHARSITRSPFPSLRAVEALAVNVPLFLLLFASTYVVMATISAGNFGERLTHTDGLYFTVTVLSTVGFGDITRQDPGGAAGCHRADDRRSGHPRTRDQGHRGRGQE